MGEEAEMAAKKVELKRLVEAMPYEQQQEFLRRSIPILKNCCQSTELTTIANQALLDPEAVL